jgi:hypothetical protein
LEIVVFFLLRFLPNVPPKSPLLFFFRLLCRWIFFRLAVTLFCQPKGQFLLDFGRGL